MIIANLATFPGRRDVLSGTLERILPQVDKVNICMNGYDEIPSFLSIDKINAFIPSQDYRDVGKFVVNDFQDDDDIFYIDDDIIYPDDYVARLMSIRSSYESLNPIVGLHGVIYPDAYDGSVGSRVVFAFRKTLTAHRVVNQLGTGTVHCKGFQAASLEFMAGSERYVDVRFAVHAKKNGWPMLCANRGENWLDETYHDETIFSSFTAKWPREVVRECQVISGYSHIDPLHVLLIEDDPIGQDNS